MAESEILTEQESALYDRQIRVWGADAQKRYAQLYLTQEEFRSPDHTEV